MLDVRLFPGLPGGTWARLRPITGADEQCVEPNDPGGFGVLVNALLVECEGTTVGPGRALDLAVADHDRMAARLFRQEYGSQLESTLRCPQCGQRFDLSFDLSRLDPDPSQFVTDEIEGPDQLGTFQLSGGPRFRLPTLRDQISVSGLNADAARQEILRRCLDQDLCAQDEIEAVERAMETVGPLIAAAITADCPHCHFQQEDVPFSIQQHLLEALAWEKRFLHHEVHQLARAYCWSRNDILAMTTADRRFHVRMILAESASR
jgi:hypothetical protein